MKRVIPHLFAALALSSCLLGPDFHGAHAPALPASWENNLPPASKDEDLRTWWASFRDPQLTALIDTAFANNPDMVMAAINISRAETQLSASRAGLFPSVSANIGGSHSGRFSTSTAHGQWSGGLSASWTPDIWGATRREIEGAFAALGSAHAAAAATRTALAAGVATVYFDWISAMESLRFAREQLAFQERSFQVVVKRVSVGMSKNLDLTEAEISLANTRAQIPSYEANIKSCENALAIYLGTTVDQVQLTKPAPAVYNLIPRVPTGLPADLLRRRPDIVRAEHQLHQATAAIGVQVANLFPRISLTGSASSNASSDFAHFFSSAGWSLMGSVSQTLLNREQLRANVKLARLSEQESAQSYRKTVLAAFAEVESCLIDYARLTNQLPRYIEAARASKRAAEISLELYKVGNTDYLNLAAAERSWLNAELNLISTRQQIRSTLARLCTALGGGWAPTPEDDKAATPA